MKGPSRPQSARAMLKFRGSTGASRERVEQACGISAFNRALWLTLLKSMLCRLEIRVPESLRAWWHVATSRLRVTASSWGWRYYW